MEIGFGASGSCVLWSYSEKLRKNSEKAVETGVK